MIRLLMVILCPLSVAAAMKLSTYGWNSAGTSNTGVKSLSREHPVKMIIQATIVSLNIWLCLFIVLKLWFLFPSLFYHTVLLHPDRYRFRQADPGRCSCHP